MTDFPDSHRDLLDAQFATLGTIGADGLPQLTEVWFLHDGDELKTSLNTARAKTKNLRERPECSLLILDVANPYRYLEVRGRARIEPDDDYSFADRLGNKYGSDLRAHDRPGETRVAVTIDPVKLYPVDMSGG
jgi:PPOX class probable F420-dependent enzyme